jgi:hypothetical protein
MHSIPDQGLLVTHLDANVDPLRHREAVEIAPGVHWIGALDPALRTFDIILLRSTEMQ